MVVLTIWERRMYGVPVRKGQLVYASRTHVVLSDPRMDKRLHRALKGSDHVHINNLGVCTIWSRPFEGLIMMIWRYAPQL
jgi:hypothetical protein